MTDQSPRFACDAGERLLARLEARRRPTRAELAAHVAEIRAAVAQEAAARSVSGLPERERYQLQLAKWRAIHRFVYQTPYRDRAGIKRSDQWRAVLDRVRLLGEPELIDWVALQIEVAGNREKGLPDMRPRKNGPTFVVLLEYVANRKRKCLALLKWAIGAEREGGLTSNSGTLTTPLRDLHRAASARDRGNERL
ncbi:MAG: hypothetical protein F9K29_06655 [Hyphomicrobiaceae bacterium]|nr:MAG: hypothetical protein F9K29_06655 [Hyphomicrobiaceae bacterium]